MSIEVTARHMHATDGLQDYAHRKAEEFLEDFPIIEHIHVILDIEKHRKRHIAEVVFRVKRHGSLEAAGASDNLRASIDMAFEKAQKQAGKLRDKIQDHKSAMKKGESRRVQGV
jgi:putative sigma-54 modulation protein